MKTCEILGTNIAVTTMAETVAFLERELERLRGSYICVSNVHTTVMAYEDEMYRKTVVCLQQKARLSGGGTRHRS